jgi:hypothetical protein
MNNYLYLNTLAERTTRLSGADMSKLCNLAKSYAIREHIAAHGDHDAESQLQICHFERALPLVQPSVSDDVLEKYASYNNSLRTGQKFKAPKSNSNSQTQTLDALRAQIQDEVKQQLDENASPQQVLNEVLKKFMTQSTQQKNEEEHDQMEIEQKSSESRIRKSGGREQRS